MSYSLELMFFCVFAPKALRNRIPTADSLRAGCRGVVRRWDGIASWLRPWELKRGRFAGQGTHRGADGISNPNYENIESRAHIGAPCWFDRVRPP